MTTNFLGIPVDGDIVRHGDRKTQRPLEEFAPILQAMLDDDGVIEFGWRQYTPYFNDGEPCVFSTHSVWVRTLADEHVEDLYDLEVDYNHPSIGERPVTWKGNQREYGAYEGPDEARYDRCLTLHAAVDGGEFYDVLLAAFGDHAEITVRRDGIKVEFYDHD